MTALRRLSDIGQATMHQGFEGEIREFIRRDVSMRLTRQELPASPGVENVTALIERVSGASVAEIDHLIAELQALRQMLLSEGERVRHEITGYAGLSQSAMTSLRMIADTLAQFRPQARPQAG
jgi:hypothetical protein